MNNIYFLILKSLRKVYSFTNQHHILQKENDIDAISDLIYNKLTNNNPCMIARFGAFELSTIINYLSIKNPSHSVWKYIKGEQQEWWWNKTLMNYMYTNAGFFPPSEEALSRFCKLMLSDTKEVDILGSWQQNERYLENYFSTSIIKVNRENSNPFFAKEPWTRALKGKKILVIHPFSNSILKQYEKRELLFKNPDILPKFKSLEVIKAVQSIGGSNSQFENWFEALDWMKTEMDKCDYDICLIGCGAYGFPLAAYAKRQGKKAIHLGGALQLYFGIRGKRWEGKGYVGTDHDYSTLFNEHWIRPSQDEIPNQSNKVENGCYW